MMEVSHQLQTLLQFLVTDASSIAHLAYILDHLSASCLAPSQHLQKWITRVTSLMHSKDPGARWAGICIAYRMSFLSRPLLIENAQSWVGITFPLLMKPEPVPILRVSMRYLALMLSAATHNPEFQRQVATPIVPKVSVALLAIAEKHDDRDIKTSSIRTLAQLIPLYPSLHKALTQRLFALCHGVFSGSVYHTTDDLRDATANLYAVLHFMGGRVGGADLWRNCLDGILQFSWSAWLASRTTFPTSARLSHKVMAHLRSADGQLPNTLLGPDATIENPLTTTALSLDRLKCGISTIVALLSVPVSRPVRLPIGHLAAFSWCLLASTREDEEQTHLDPHVRIAESGVVPQIWMQGCLLLTSLAQTARESLAPHMSRLITVIISQLENNPEPLERRSFLQCAHHLLHFCPVVGATLAINRLLKAATLLLSPLYLHRPSAQPNPATTSQPRPGKKRRREYEADNVLSASRTVVYVTSDECDALIGALDVVDQCMLNAELGPSSRSLANRVLLSILLSLPSIPPSSLSPDPGFHGRVAKKVRGMCVESVQGTQHAMSKGAGLVLRSFAFENLTMHDKLHSNIDLLLHPRRPPYVRTLPFVESLSLSFAEESAEETVARQALDLAFCNREIPPVAPELQTQPELTIPSKGALDLQAPLNPPQERALPAFIEPHPQTRIDGNLPVEVTVPVPAVSSLQAVPDIPVELPSPSQKEPVSSRHTAPMLLEESDHEEVPTIDLASDSDG